ncbi:MAG: TetR/AcrR family transcriptional regulator [Candidatus Latescibacterota bacterium]|jgi:AcrR family transcriptional regulator
MELHTQPAEVNLPRREREKAAHRKEIMDAAIRVFARRGINAATLDEVAQEAEFSKGAIYLYFSSKEDLIFNILYDLSQTISDTVQKIISGKRSYREELLDLYLTIAEYSFQQGDQLKIFTGENMSDFQCISKESREKLMILHYKGIKVLEERTTKAFKDGELRDIPLVAIIAMVHCSLDGLAISRWKLESFAQAKCAVNNFIDILFNGIGKIREEKS